MGARTALLYTYVQKRITRGGGLGKRVPPPSCHSSSILRQKKKESSHLMLPPSWSVFLRLAHTHARTHHATAAELDEEQQEQERHRSPPTGGRTRPLALLRCGTHWVSHWQALLQWRSGRALKSSSQRQPQQTKLAVLLSHFAPPRNTTATYDTARHCRRRLRWSLLVLAVQHTSVGHMHTHAHERERCLHPLARPRQSSQRRAASSPASWP